MNVMRQLVGPTAVEWQEEAPLEWQMTETRGEGKHARDHTEHFDLTPLQACYSRTFLLAFKEFTVSRRQTVSLKSLKVQYDHIRRVLEIFQDHLIRVSSQATLKPVVFERIDSEFLQGLAAIQNDVSYFYLDRLRALYTMERANPALFAPDLHAGDFPMGSRGQESDLGKKRQAALTKAMSRSMLVHILNVTEAAFETGKMDLGRYAFSRLLLSRAARPETYRQLRCKDLRVDTKGGVVSYFLTLTIPKTERLTPPQVPIAIPADVGRLLERQREAVVNRMEHLVEAKNALLDQADARLWRYTIGDLPLFPALYLKNLDSKTMDGLGMYLTSHSFRASYVDPLKRFTGTEITCGAMRHTMATQLAIAGCSAGTIAAVLLHATDRTAQVYVDLFFDGAITELSDSMEPAFVDHFPAFKDFLSKHDAIEPEKRIVSYSDDGSKRETTGGCGGLRICENAPLSCYDCHRFKPCWDADHTINLDLVNEEIEAARHGGLQRQNDVRRYMHIGNRIRVVISVCELKRQAMEAGSANGVAA